MRRVAIMATAAAAWVLAAVAAAAPAGLSLELRQGTDLSISAAPADVRVIGLAGRLWRLPAAGGDAVAITPAGEYARRPALSPDGRLLAYEALRDGHFQLMLANADGSEPQQLTSGPWHHLAPAWSPDGQRLAMAANRSGDFSIWLVQRDSGALAQISFDRGDELDPAWDPVGEGLAYVSDAGGRSALVLRTPTQPRRVLVDGSQRLRAPAWRPDGSVISYVAADSQGGRLNMVILSAPPVIKPMVRGENAFATPIAWIDRSHFLYAANGQLRQRVFGALGVTDLPFRASIEVRKAPEPLPRRLPDGGENRPVRGLGGLATLPDGHLVVSALGDLWELDRDGGLVRAITQDVFADSDPATSRDGRWLAFTSDRSGSPQVWLMDLANRSSRVLTAEAGGASEPAPDATAGRIAYLAGEPGSARRSLKLLTLADGKVAEIATGLVAAGTPAWSPDDGQLALVQDDGGIRRLLLFAPVAGSTVRRVTLPEPAAAAGRNELAWSPDGKSIAIASAAGIRELPVLANGLVGADWRPRHDGPVQLLRWASSPGELLFADAQGLASSTPDTATRRLPVALSWRAAQGSGRTVIRAGRLFDGIGDGYRFDQQIVIEGNRITAVGPWADADAATAGATVIDARNQTVVPGLIDLALQLPDSAGASTGRRLLAFGITTAQVVAASGTELAGLTERWQAHVAGPRLLRSPERCNDTTATAGSGEDGMDGAQRLCPALVMPDGAAPLAAAPALPVWSSSWLAAASGQVTAISPFRANGQRPDTVFPVLLSPYQDAIDVMLRSGTALVPDLAGRGLPVLAEDQPGLFMAPQYLALAGAGERQALAGRWQALMAAEGQSRRAWLRDAQRLLGRYVAGGGRIGAASGSPAVPYGLGLHAELRLMAGAGLPAAAVLRAATGDAARMLGLQEEIGSLAAGRRADLLVVDGDPLASLDQLLAIRTIMLDGALRPAATLLPEAGPAVALEKFTPAPAPAKTKRRNPAR